ncbi:erythromycin esterase family protein [Streptoalloteichus hindustanus]|uniref:Erythromycin esterase n=1 Tax=Streptoalloteichus hindustanus TaxID=2017 RepID=A0A1M5NZ33_STRHI|nr:erythromycin esterase family protein [Streptoalloteichus hindustanus]SHG94727.1 erythromycin esterase [Streptoalloteichus hindustanus]
MRDRKHFRRRGVLAASVIAVGAVLAPAVAHAAPAGTADSAGVRRNPVHALVLAAHPLLSTEPGGNTADLRALGAMIGDAGVVGLGEATHGSHEFFAMKERVFRYLVEERGFTTFALELSWSAGVRIDDYLRTGRGDARQVAKEALANSPWDREEFVSLIQWMRGHNQRHPDRPVRFMGDDIGAPSVTDDFFGRVTDHVRQHNPEALPRLNELYTGLRPIDDAFAYLRKPLEERQRLAARAQQALELVSGLGNSGGDAWAWVEQHARFIAQTAQFLTIDVTNPASVTASERFRDEVMAQNVIWWQRRTGHKMLLSAHNGHVGYVSSQPQVYPRTQGSLLRDALGRSYRPIGFTFNRGSFLSKDASLNSDWKKFTVGPAERGMNEHTLDRVPHRNYYLDMRTAPASARAWLDIARPTRDFGSSYPAEPGTVALGRAFDVLIHLHEVREARPRT